MRLSFLASCLVLAVAVQLCHADSGMAPPGMVYIPGGEFVMGSDGFQNSSPAHVVELSPFFIDATEVTNAQYLEFCEATGHRAPEFWGMSVYRSGPDYPDHPVVGVSWWDASAYARWRDARLPTEAEWECAGRGGLVGMAYTHGDELDPELYGETGYTGTAGPAPVRSHPPNGWGLYEMNGNVSEWVSDRYGVDYYAHSPMIDPQGPPSGVSRVVRGGGWHTGPGCFPVYYRTPLKSNWVDFNVGFRCAMSVGESASARLEAALSEDGLEGALELFWSMLRTEPGAYYFDENELDDLGHRLLEAGRALHAVEVMRMTVQLRPTSYEARRSLGESLRALGNRGEAVRAFEQALELNPHSGTTRAMLEELRGEP